MTTMARLCFSVMACAGGAASAAGGAETASLAADLDAGEFRRMHDLMKPRAEEVRWLEIPWESSLWEARRRAAAEGKPILLWEMDGHPLGCT